MDIEYIKLSSLIPYEFNNRNHKEEQVDRIANSIKEFGFNQPIVIDESNIILIGHGRHLAALKLGLKEVPALQLKNLTEAQKKAYRILDNKLQNDSTWSFDNLELELGFLEDEGFNLEEWGLDDLLIKPDLLDSVDLGGEDRVSDYSRTFTLTKEQAESVDRAIEEATKLIEGEGNRNGRAITLICETYTTQNG
jgi:ParB-like chromosome segregation protein Spo0J